MLANSTLLIIAIAGLVTLSVGAILWVFFAPALATEAQRDKRIEAITDRARVSVERRTVQEQSVRRRNVQSVLKEIDQKQKTTAKKTTSPPLSVRLLQAGLDWSITKYVIVSIVCGLVSAAAAFAAGVPLYIVAGAAFVGGFGLPRLYVSRARKRRIKKFVDEFPNAVDVIVRGVKSGLPLRDCLRIVATEAREPVRTEFRRIIEAEAIGQPLTDACAKLFERVPVQEANFFGIVIMIQQKAGTNLSEVLGNVSKVLRERKKMKAKISAMSMEAKASASIIGSLPIIVMGLVYLTSPNYIMLLFTKTTGHIILLGSALTMMAGILIMKKMISFDF